MLRRRLNTMGRACIAEMLAQLEENEDIPLVYCSRHGDIERTLKILKDQACGEPASPMDFSLAVHNAITGIISIHCGIRENISSIASDSGYLVPALLDASGLLDQGHEDVLVIISDARLPEIYRETDDAGEYPFAACFRVTRFAGIALEIGYTGDSQQACHSEPDEVLGFIDFLTSDRNHFSTRHNGGVWSLTKCIN